MGFRSLDHSIGRPITRWVSGLALGDGLENALEFLLRAEVHLDPSPTPLADDSHAGPEGEPELIFGGAGIGVVRALRSAGRRAFALDEAFRLTDGQTPRDDFAGEAALRGF